jgi:hypothetical protein
MPWLITVVDLLISARLSRVRRRCVYTRVSVPSISILFFKRKEEED